MEYRLERWCAAEGVCSVCMEGRGTGERYEIRLGFHAVSRCARLGLS